MVLQNKPHHKAGVIFEDDTSDKQKWLYEEKTLKWMRSPNMSNKKIKRNLYENRNLKRLQASDNVMTFENNLFRLSHSTNRAKSDHLKNNR